MRGILFAILTLSLSAQAQEQAHGIRIPTPPRNICELYRLQKENCIDHDKGVFWEKNVERLKKSEGKCCNGTPYQIVLINEHVAFKDVVNKITWYFNRGKQKSTSQAEARKECAQLSPGGDLPHKADIDVATQQSLFQILDFTKLTGASSVNFWTQDQKQSYEKKFGTYPTAAIYEEVEAGGKVVHEHRIDPTYNADGVPGKRQLLTSDPKEVPGKGGIYPICVVTNI